MNLKVKNYELDTFAYLLFEMQLGNKKSRMRTKLFKLLQNHLVELKESNEALVEEYAVHDESGQLVYADDDKTQIKLDAATEKEFHKERQILLNEEIVVEASEANLDMLLTVAQSFLDEEIVVNKNDAMIYDNLCERFEEILAEHVYEEDQQI